MTRGVFHHIRKHSGTKQRRTPLSEFCLICDPVPQSDLRHFTQAQVFGQGSCLTPGLRFLSACSKPGPRWQGNLFTCALQLSGDQGLFSSECHSSHGDGDVSNSIISFSIVPSSSEGVLQSDDEVDGPVPRQNASSFQSEPSQTTAGVSTEPQQM